MDEEAQLKASLRRGMRVRIAAAVFIAVLAIGGGAMAWKLGRLTPCERLARWMGDRAGASKDKVALISKGLRERKTDEWCASSLDVIEMAPDTLKPAIAGGVVREAFGSEMDERIDQARAQAGLPPVEPPAPVAASDAGF